MTTFITILHVVLCVALVALLFVSIIFTSDKTYFYFFEHKEWKLWEWYIKNYHMFTFDYSSGGVAMFRTDANINAVVWKSGLASIHDGTVCVLCTFDRYHAKKMAELLLSKVPEDIKTNGNNSVK